eukprot:IDg10914t1
MDREDSTTISAEPTSTITAPLPIASSLEPHQPAAVNETDTICPAQPTAELESDAAVQTFHCPV